MQHTNKTECKLCEAKLEFVRPELVVWFHFVCENFEGAHIAWGWRDAKDQDAAFAQHRSTFKWPESPHNATENGLPCSRALDLFKLDPTGRAVFDEAWYGAIDALTKENKYPIRWGGDFNHLKDFDHFEVIEEKKT
jgi:hypothetical protein